VDLSAAQDDPAGHGRLDAVSPKLGVGDARVRALNETIVLSLMEM
jgi:hypothetical protein